MAIKQEFFEVNGRAFTKTYSNEYRYIVRDGVSYISAIDPSEFNREYAEGDLIDTIEDDYEIVGRILTGANLDSNIIEDEDYEEKRKDYIEVGKMFLEVNDNDNS